MRQLRLPPADTCGLPRPACLSVRVAIKLREWHVPRLKAPPRTYCALLGQTLRKAQESTICDPQKLQLHTVNRKGHQCYYHMGPFSSESWSPSLVRPPRGYRTTRGVVTKCSISLHYSGFLCTMRLGKQGLSHRPLCAGNGTDVVWSLGQCPH